MNNMMNEDIIKIINNVKFMENTDGRFYRQGWKDACDQILKIVNNNSDFTIKNLDITEGEFD